MAEAAARRGEADGMASLSAEAVTGDSVVRPDSSQFAENWYAVTAYVSGKATTAVRILLTGMSCSGKSTLVSALTQCGHRAIDLDAPAWSEYRVLTEDDLPPGVEPGRDWVWREGQVAELLKKGSGQPLFLAGCAPNQGRFRRELDRIVLLTAPVDVTLTRLAARTTNPFGKHPQERAKILADKATFEPLLRASSDLVVETTEPVEATVRRLLKLVEH